MHIPNNFRNAAARLGRGTLALFVLALCLAAPAAAARQREHLTPEEIELVRDNQELDARTDVFIKAAERRLLAITNPAEAAKNAARDKEKWGEVKGSREQLFYDISKILDEAVVNVDDWGEHHPESPLLRRSLYMLAEEANRLLPELTKLREAAASEGEADQLERALETAREITDAAKERGVTAEDLKVKAKAASKKNDKND
jgi:nucleotide-binding universal stress UspA family protein